MLRTCKLEVTTERSISMNITLLILGIVTFGIHLCPLYRILIRWIFCTDTIVGTITEVDAKTDAFSVVRYMIHVEYQVDGIKYEGKPMFAIAEADRGNTIDLHYNASKPKMFYVDAASGKLWVWYYILMVLIGLYPILNYIF